MNNILKNIIKTSVIFVLGTLCGWSVAYKYFKKTELPELTEEMLERGVKKARELSKPNNVKD